jgi:hypothetical protein
MKPALIATPQSLWQLAVMAQFYAGDQARLLTMPELLDFVSDAGTESGLSEPRGRFLTGSLEFIGRSKLGNPVMAVLHGVSELSSPEHLPTLHRDSLPRSTFLDILDGRYGEVLIVDFAEASCTYQYDCRAFCEQDEDQILTDKALVARMGGLRQAERMLRYWRYRSKQNGNDVYARLFHYSALGWDFPPGDAISVSMLCLTHQPTEDAVWSHITHITNDMIEGATAVLTSGQGSLEGAHASEVRPLTFLDGERYPLKPKSRRQWASFRDIALVFSSEFTSIKGVPARCSSLVLTDRGSIFHYVETPETEAHRIGEQFSFILSAGEPLRSKLSIRFGKRLSGVNAVEIVHVRHIEDGRREVTVQLMALDRRHFRSVGYNEAVSVESLFSALRLGGML